jgi:drug/metabolite transporter (DMT)-like permease
MLPWYAFSISSAIAEAANQAVSKKFLSDADPLFTSLALSLFSVPWLALALIGQSAPEFSPALFETLLASSLCYGLARILFIEAILASPLSVSVPINAFTPAFLILTSWAMLGEMPTAFGFAGIFLIVIGSYVLNLNLRVDGFLKPLSAIITEKGSRLMLVVALLWSIAPNFDRRGLMHANPTVWVFMLNVSMTLLTAVYWFLSRQRRDKASPERSALPIYALNGLLMTVQLLGHVTALGMTLVTYASAVRRINSIFGVALGAIFFKEKGIRDRLAGAVLMTAGAILILLKA